MKVCFVLNCWIFPNYGLFQKLVFVPKHVQDSKSWYVRKWKTLSCFENDMGKNQNTFMCIYYSATFKSIRLVCYLYWSRLYIVMIGFHLKILFLACVVFKEWCYIKSMSRYYNLSTLCLNLSWVENLENRSSTLQDLIQDRR